MRKEDVRRIAAELGLAVAAKPDSYEICFVPGNNYSQFLEAYLDEQQETTSAKPGDLVSSNGTILGRHAGVHQFTVGQRKGLGVATGSPLYVLDINPENRQVTVGEDRELYRRELVASGARWITGEPPADPVRVEARIRNKHTPAPAWAEALPDDRLRVTFDEPQRAITPGQSVVLYQDELVLGGAWIDSSR
jgi:tRNA-specific 2-thiouridylase